jgi:hypothetical protein
MKTPAVVETWYNNLIEPYYYGRRTEGGCQVFYNADPLMGPGHLLPLGPSQAVQNHSPDGFEWGYGGSGPAQLALALLLHAGQDPDWALRLHQAFKWRYVGAFPKESWQLLRAEILGFLHGAQIVMKSLAKVDYAASSQPAQDPPRNGDDAVAGR